MSLKRPLHPFSFSYTKSMAVICKVYQVLQLSFGGVMYMHRYQNGGLTLAFWFDTFNDNIRFNGGETLYVRATYEGMHTKKVQQGLKMGVNVIYSFRSYVFFCIFLGHFSIQVCHQQIEIGSIWPPAGIAVFKPLVISIIKHHNYYLHLGITITYAHHALTLW
jgi:hypothetical protein